MMNVKSILSLTVLGFSLFAHADCDLEKLRKEIRDEALLDHGAILATKEGGSVKGTVKVPRRSVRVSEDFITIDNINYLVVTNKAKLKFENGTSFSIKVASIVKIEADCSIKRNEHNVFLINGGSIARIKN